MKDKDRIEKNNQLHLPVHKERRPYRSPRLVEYGTLRELTHGDVGLEDDAPGTRKDA